MKPIRDSDNRVLKIRARLISAFEPSELEVVDESHLHAGHPGARDGRGHYRVTIVSSKFAGRSRLERHRMVFAALGALMETDIHALSVTALDQAPTQMH
jgi:BolA protein